ncbi:hypothetical protein ABVT39_017205 [Epinephelus coioides]
MPSVLCERVLQPVFLGHECASWREYAQQEKPHSCCLYITAVLKPLRRHSSILNIAKGEQTV